jgi:hypothetical protein
MLTFIIYAAMAPIIAPIALAIVLYPIAAIGFVISLIDKLLKVKHG